MTAEEIHARAIAAEKRAKREYYMEHRDEILVKMREYSRTHREQLLPRERAWRENNQVWYFDNQVKYWTRKAESAQDEHEAKVCRWRLKYAIKKLKEAKEKEK